MIIHKRIRPRRFPVTACTKEDSLERTYPFKVILKSSQTWDRVTCKKCLDMSEEVVIKKRVFKKKRIINDARRKRGLPLL